jgi:hypothetical protein
MNGLTDSLTVGLVLTLIFGALVFYLYTRIGQVEKRVSLTENILLDLKMATENTLMAMSPPSYISDHGHSQEMERVDAPEPMKEEVEVEEVNEEEFYKTVLEQAAQKPSDAPVSGSATMESGSKLEVSYESMTLKELKDEAKRKGVKVSANAHKKDIIDALKRQGNGQGSILEPVPGGSLDGQLEEGFPVELTK